MSQDSNISNSKLFKPIKLKTLNRKVVKKILKYCIIVIALVTGAMAINIYSPNSHKISKDYSQEKSQHQSTDFYFNSFQIDLPDNCNTNEEFRVVNNLTFSAGRILIHAFSHSITQSSRLTNSKFNANRILYLVFLSNNYQNGYYLYALCKLLI